MRDPITKKVLDVSTPPEDKGAFDAWLTALDGVEFLKSNARDEQFVFYATPRQTFIHTVMVPASNLDPPDVRDLMAWNFNAYGSWGVSYTLSDKPDISLEGPFDGYTDSFRGGTRLIFPRDFEGRLGHTHYWELLQPFAHVRSPLRGRAQRVLQTRRER